MSNASASGFWSAQTRLPFLVGGLLWFAARPAVAQVSLPPLNASLLTSLSFPELLRDTSDGKLISSAGGGSFHGGGGRRGGLLFDADLGGAVPLPLGGLVPRATFALGVAVGYQAGNGLGLMFRYDDLGLPLGSNGTRFQFATAAVRYTFPYPIPMPFVEAAAGVAFLSSSATTIEAGPSGWSPGGAVGVGVAIPLSHHAAIDVGLRDWVAAANGSVFQVVSLQAGFNFTVGGEPRRDL